MKILLDKVSYKCKPSAEAGAINKRISQCIYEITDMKHTAEQIGTHGHSWCPAVFYNSRRENDFKEAQLLTLDFDGGKSFDEVIQISKEYMLPVLFAYETFSSINSDKFRIVFKYEKIITDVISFDIIMDMLRYIFDGCDTSCRDTSGMFFGGKKLIYFNQKERAISQHNLIMNFHKYFKDRYGQTHYKDHIRKYARDKKLDINKKAILQLGKISPSSILDINGNGEKLPNHKDYRSDTLDKLKDSCRLFHEFVSDSSWLYYNQLFGIALNLIHVEKGTALFLDTVRGSQYDTYKRDWEFYLSYFKNSGYMPMRCDSFCPYNDSCPHNANMLCTAKVKRKEILRVAQYNYVSADEAYTDLQNSFNNAVKAHDDRIHLIKAQTAIGKTHMYLEYLKNAKRPCLIAVPTNILKNEVYQKCIELGINALKTPSVEEIKDNLPEKVYAHIQMLYNTGKHNRVYRYIQSILKTEDIPVLKDFIEEKERLKNFKGHIITTHHRVLYAQKEWLKKYQIIIDEDILKTIICNNETILISDIEGLLEKGLPENIRSKMINIISKSETEKYFKTDNVKIKSDIDAPFDIEALMKAKKIYSDGERIMFYKTPQLKNMKYIVLSATADEYIYSQYFGNDKICFYNCKQAEYDGTLKQYYKESYSRNYINKNEDVFDRVKKITGDIPTITFKAHSDGCEIHFGNSEGCNFMSGKDIAVVGTPHLAECVYKLMAYHIQDDISGESHFRFTEHNGFKFWFHTYENELIRHIQFWLIESELEQSVGRARLLRNNCTVHLFSNFPLQHSTLV